MDEFIEVFGNYSVGSLILLVAAFVFLCKIYREMKKVIVEQHD